MSPQKFVKEVPPGFTEVNTPEDFLKVKSFPQGFSVIYLLHGYPNHYAYFPENKIAVRLPDGRLVIPTVKGEKE